MPGLMIFERHAPLDRLVLLGHVDDAHAAFADLLQQLVGADLRAGLLRDGVVESHAESGWRRFKQTPGFPI